MRKENRNKYKAAYVAALLFAFPFDRHTRFLLPLVRKSAVFRHAQAFSPFSYPNDASIQTSLLKKKQMTSVKTGVNMLSGSDILTFWEKYIDKCKDRG
ncbi:hypothetical protein CVD19_11010 [Bacillus sp. T33-2]|nr:hypothetical protein CVD19_11010 [Bacillus sp. T33-2]